MNNNYTKVGRAPPILTNFVLQELNIREVDTVTDLSKTLMCLPMNALKKIIYRLGKIFVCYLYYNQLKLRQ